MEEKNMIAMEGQVETGQTTEEQAPVEEAAVYNIKPDQKEGAATLFLYTKGTKGVPIYIARKARRQLLSIAAKDIEAIKETLYSKGKSPER